jgi:hypothetical protein
MAEVNEAEVVAACEEGRILECADAGGRRPVDAALLRRCCDELSDRVHRHGLRLRGAEVVGPLDLSGLDIGFPLLFEDCEFDSPLGIEGAQLFEVRAVGCARLPGLLANGVRIRRDLDLSRSLVAGALRSSASTSRRSAVWLCESEIGGRLLCVDTVIDGGAERSIQADGMRTGGNVRLMHKFTARGELRLIGARIGGSLDLPGAELESPLTGLALDLGEAVIEGSIFLTDDPSGRRPHIRGRIDMGRARIGGQFLVRNATLEAVGSVPVGSAYSRARSEGTAVSAPRLSVGAELTVEGTCTVTGGIDLSMSELSSVSIGPECSLRSPGRTALDLTNAQLLSDLRLGSGATVQGTTRLTGTRIHGRLSLSGARLSEPESKSLIAAQGVFVGGVTSLQGLHATGGRLRFSTSTLASVIARGARIVNPGGFTLSLHQATVKGSVELVEGFYSEGLLDLSRSAIEGRLECDGGTFTCPGPAKRNEYGHAIEAVSATIRGGIYMARASISAGVDFTNATTTFLVDDPGNWPPGFIISGFTYDRFDQPRGSAASPAWDHAARCAWLSRQAVYDAGPYEQAARVFRQHGYTSGARAILSHSAGTPAVLSPASGRCRAALWTPPSASRSATATGPAASCGCSPSWLSSSPAPSCRPVPEPPCGPLPPQAPFTPPRDPSDPRAQRPPRRTPRAPPRRRMPPPMPAAQARSSASTRSCTPSTPSSRWYRSTRGRHGTQMPAPRTAPSCNGGSTPPPSWAGYCLPSSCCPWPAWPDPYDQQAGKAKIITPPTPRW